MLSVESVVVWSSMSRVTVVPALRAARQIARAFSRAIFSPLSGSAWPIALSLTDTSALRVRPREASSLRTSTYAATVASACSASVVSSPRKSSVTRIPSAISTALASTTDSVVSPGT